MGGRLSWSISAERKPLHWPNDNSWKHNRQLLESNAKPHNVNERHGGQEILGFTQWFWCIQKTDGTSDGGSVGSKKELVGEKANQREAIPWQRQVGDGNEHFLAALRRVRLLYEWRALSNVGQWRIEGKGRCREINAHLGFIPSNLRCPSQGRLWTEYKEVKNAQNCLCLDGGSVICDCYFYWTRKDQVCNVDLKIGLKI